MSAFKILNRNNPCPVCSSSDGRCREAGDLILCMTNPDGGAIAGWHFLGSSKDGLWGKWVPQSDRAYSEEEKREYRERQQQRERERQRLEQERAAASMPVQQRDYWYRLLLAELSLEECDRADLRRRGLSDELIDARGYRSVAPGQQLTRQYPVNLPGVMGDRVTVSGAGYLIPALTVDGAIAGFQIRLRDAESGRYRWLSNRANPAKLETGELPITVAYPAIPDPDRSGWLGFSEGILKPQIAADRLGFPVIGASGGNFGKGLGQIQAAIALLQPNKLVLLPDAGAVRNPQILGHYRKLAGAIAHLQVSKLVLLPDDGAGRNILAKPRKLPKLIDGLQVAWWGQGTKESPDPDEVTDSVSLKVISWEKFEAIADSMSDRDHFIQKRLMRFKTSYWEQLRRDFILSKADCVYEGYAPTLDLEKQTILLRGWLGAGKTEATLRSLLAQCRDRQIIWITGRNGLLSQTAERAARLGFSAIYHYQDDPATRREQLQRGAAGIFTMCFDSLKDYAIGGVDWSQTVLIIDEFSGVRREILEKSAVVPEFERILKEADLVIAVDALAGDVDRRLLNKYRTAKTEPTTQKPATVRRLTTIAPVAIAASSAKERKAFVYDQQFAKSPKKIKWLETRNKEGAVSFSHDGIGYPLIREWMSAGKRFCIATDSKLVSKALSEFAANQGYQGVLVSSETINSNKSVLPDPDGALATAQFFVYTPTAQSGLDVQLPFDCGLAIYCGVLSPLDFLQMMGRCRQCDEWWVSAARRSLDPACPVPSLDSKRCRDWGSQLAETFSELGTQTSAQSVGWGLWQSLTKEVERAFHSEYLQCLLEYFFESVETIEVECDRSQWREDTARIKLKELELMLSADLENGQRLQRLQKSPGSDSEVWDVQIAQEHEKFPRIWDELIAQWRSQQDKEDCLKLARLFSSRRLNRFKNWVQATGQHADEDLEALQQSIRRQFTSYSSPRWKTLQNLSLFQILKLDRLATAGIVAIAHKTHYRYDSPLILQLWHQFQQSPRLQRLFPEIETLHDFWGIVRRCMAFFGYQSAGKTIRVATPGQLHPNGRDRQGNERFVASKSFYFSAWVPMAESGSKFFQQNFELIVEAISNRLDRERRNRTPIDIGESPPIAA